MKLILYLSDFMIPLVIFYIVGYGMMMKSEVYKNFVSGAADGLKTVAGIAPTLIGLMVGVGVMRASGLLDGISGIFAVVSERVNFPSELVPLAIVRLFSSSAATGLVIDAYKSYGTDSYIGTVASIMMGCTDTMLILRGSEEYLQIQGLEFVLIKRACPLCYHFAGCSGLAAD